MWSRLVGCGELVKVTRLVDMGWIIHTLGTSRVTI